MPRPIACFILLAVACWAPSACGDGRVRTIALEGSNATWDPPEIDVTFDGSFSAPVIDATGAATFRATVGGVGSLGLGVWRETAAGLELIARSGQGAPGNPDGVNFVGLDNPLYNVEGEVAFRASTTQVISGIPINGVGVWSDVGGDLELVAQRRQALEDPLSNFSYRDFDQPVLNASGQLAFKSEVRMMPATRDAVLIVEPEASPEPLAYGQGPVPGVGPGAIFIDLYSPLLSDNGQALFSASIAGDGIDDSNERGLWRGADSTSLQLIAQEGTPAIGAPPGRVFRSFSGRISVNGRVAFRANATEPDSFLGLRGLWRENAVSALELMAIEGQQAPGLPEGLEYSGFSDFLIDDQGRVAFQAVTTDPDGLLDPVSGIWTENQAGEVTLYAKQGDQAPGLPAGFEFVSFRSLSVNSAGRVAFRSEVIGPGEDDVLTEVLWAEDPNGVLHPIVMEGQQLDVNDDPSVEDLRTISSIAFVSGVGGGTSSGFNLRGDMAFQAVFADGDTGLFVSSRAVLPGDFNGDLAADAADYEAWRAAYGSEILSGAGADANGDGLVNAADYSVWRDATTQSAFVVPEPTTACLVTLALIGAAARRY